MGYRELWQRLEKFNTRRMSRRTRRFVIVIPAFSCLAYYAMAIGDLRGGLSSGRLYGFASCIASLMAVGNTVFWMWFYRRVAFNASLDERAQMDFGKAYSELSKMHRFDVRVRARREGLRGGRPMDERDILMQREAERRAFKVLKIGLPVFVLAYWVVCLCLPVGPVRVGLLISAVVVSGMAIPVMILPDLIRLWTEPDEVLEMQATAREREA